MSAVEVWHPGVFLAEEMSARGWTSADVAQSALAASRAECARLKQRAEAAELELGKWIVAEIDVTRKR